MKIFIVAIWVVFSFQLTNAQFVTKGTIEFEKTVNLYKRMEMSDEGWSAEIKKTIPEHRRTYFNLTFDGDKTIYKPGKESPDRLVNSWYDGPAAENIVYSDLGKQSVVAAKQVFDEAFLVQDSLKKYKWRITNDTRKIAGFDCRRATTVIMDSVFVVAFYTEEIIPPGGPESFQGLPGMILGIVIPRMFTNWYATKVELTPVKPTTIVPPKKGKNTDEKGMSKTIQDSLKRWGKWGTKFIWAIMI